jgi:hypothetical protein
VFSLFCLAIGMISGRLGLSFPAVRSFTPGDSAPSSVPGVVLLLFSLLWVSCPGRWFASHPKDYLPTGHSIHLHWLLLNILKFITAPREETVEWTSFSEGNNWSKTHFFGLLNPCYLYSLCF